MIREFNVQLNLYDIVPTRKVTIDLQQILINHLNSNKIIKIQVKMFSIIITSTYLGLGTTW